MGMTTCNASSVPCACLRVNKGDRAWRAGSTFVSIAFLLLAGCDRGGAQARNADGKKIWNDFSGDKALAHVQAMVDFGPRPPGSEAIEKTRTYLVQQLEAAGWKVERQGFSDDTPRGKVQFVNLIATFGAAASAPSFLVCSHYDTKTFDNAVFVGANDAGSSTGVLVEIARVMAERPD